MKRTRTAAALIATAALAGSSLLAMLPATAVAPAQHLGSSLFEIDGDKDPGSDPPPGPDWNQNSSYLWTAQTPPIIGQADKLDTTPKAEDGSFAQGTKSDTPVPVIETGSIPPNKSDLTRMLVASQTFGGDIYLYIAWERANTLGSANMNFEFNASQTKSGNGVTPVRSAGDVLITYDFSNGGSNVNLGLAKWAQSSCEASGGKTPDCWSPLQDLDSTGIALGRVSSDGKFGEAAINLTDAGVFTEGQCTSLGSAYLSSRSSDSFTAALKDFVPPKDISITNCGSIEVTKTDDASPANPLSGAAFTLFHNVAPLAGPRDTATDLVTDPALGCTTGSNGKCVISNVPLGDYWLVETTVPNGYSGAPDWAVSITSTAQVSHTFVDPRLRGAIKITKTAKFKAGEGVNPGLGATFTVTTSEGDKTVSTSAGTGTEATACLTGLLFGTYTVKETTGPTGYTTGADVTGVTVNQAASDCTDATKVASASFTNTPRSDVTVGFTPQVTGATAARISCTGLSPATADTTPDVYDDTSETYANLIPGTYTCTIVVDP